jgi:hypothetical protein
MMSIELNHIIFPAHDKHAAGGVAGRGHGLRAFAEVEDVAVVEFAVDAYGGVRLVRHLAVDLLEDGTLPVSEVRGRPGRLAPDERRVGVYTVTSPQPAISAAAPMWSP